MQPADVIRDFVAGHEGGYQNMVEDRGNVVLDRSGEFVPKRFANGKTAKFDVAARTAALRAGGRVIGTMRGVTPDTYARFLGCDVRQIDEQQMKDIDEDTAVDIGMQLYYQKPGIDRLPWGPITAILLDMAWGAGPTTAIMFIQKRIGVRADGQIGPDTVDAWNRWIEKQGIAKAAENFADWKIAAYEADVRNNPAQKKWLGGWINRANYFRPRNKKWWGKFETGTSVYVKPTGDVYETDDETGRERRLDVNSSPAVTTSKRGLFATIGSFIAGMGYMAQSLIKDIADIFPPWMWGALGLGAAIFAALYFTGIIKLRRADHKEWKH